MHHLKRGNSRLRETLGASLLPRFFCSILLLVHIKTTKKPKETNDQRFQGKQRKGLRAAAVAYQQRRGTERAGAGGRPRPGRQLAHLKARTRQVGRAGPGARPARGGGGRPRGAGGTEPLCPDRAWRCCCISRLSELALGTGASLRVVQPFQWSPGSTVTLMHGLQQQHGSMTRWQLLRIKWHRKEVHWRWILLIVESHTPPLDSKPESQAAWATRGITCRQY